MHADIAQKLYAKLQNVPKYADYKVIACAFIGKSAVFGVNMPKSHPLQKQFGKNSNAIFLHAEIDLLRKLRKFSILPTEIYILRATNWHILPSLPCKNCEIALKKYGITQFIDCYTAL